MNKIYTHYTNTLGRINILFTVLLLLALPLLNTNFVQAEDASSKYRVLVGANGVASTTTASVNKGDIVTVILKAYVLDDGGRTSDSVDGSLSFDPNKLEILNKSAVSGGYALSTLTSTTNSVRFVGTYSPAGDGGISVLTANFRAKAAASPTTILTDNGTSKINGTISPIDSVNAGKVTIIDNTPPPATYTPPPKTTPTPYTPPVQTPKATPTPTTTPPKDDDTYQPATPDPTGVIDNVEVSTSYTSATISWTVKADNSSATLDYGDSLSEIDKHSEVTKADGKFSAKMTKLTPGKRYSFTISAKGTGVSNSSYSGSATTDGYPVRFTVTENDIAIKNGLLKVGSSTYPISGDKVTIGLAAGKYSATISTDTASSTQDITVAAKEIPADGGDPEMQLFKFALTSTIVEGGPGTGTSALTFIGVLIGGIAFLAIGLVVFVTIRRKRMESDGYSSYKSYSSGPTIKIEDGYDWRNDTTPASPQPPVQGPDTSSFNKSVYIDEEVTDMFDSSNIKIPPSAPSETPQSPNSQHSTKP